MDENLEIIFENMLNQDDVAGAVEFINSIDYSNIPSESIIRKIIFEVLMKCTHIRTLGEAKLYLMNILDIYPPDDANRRKFYYNSLRDFRGINSELWPVFCYIINSCFCNYGLCKGDEDSSQQSIRIPNCFFVLDFYIQVISRDFENLSCEKGIYASYKELLIVKLLWPNSEIGAFKNHVEILYKWINDVYLAPQVPKKSDILNFLHKLLILMVKCVVNMKHGLSDTAAVNSNYMAEIVDDIMNKCKDAYDSIANVKLFMTSLTLKILRVKVCEKVVAKMICQPSRTFVALTLRNIVNYYMFKSKRKGPSGKSSISKSKHPKRNLPKIEVKARKGDTVLHEYAKQNKFADLLTALNEDVNKKNDCGFTPLHEACIANSFMSAKVLLTETGKGTVPEIHLYATCNEGLTALHYAVCANSGDIVKMMLKHGGARLLNVVDPKGRKITSFSHSLEMDNILEKYADFSEQDNATDGNGQGQWPHEAPSFPFYKNYGIYLHALACLLSTYTDVFNLYDLLFKSPSTRIRSHKDKLCFHYYADEKNEYTVCSDDASLIKEMPGLINNFIKSIKKHTAKKNLNVDIELIPLKGYSSSLIV